MAPEPIASMAPQLARRLVEVTDEAVLVLDSSGVVRSANQAASRALGLPLTAFVGRAVEALHDRFPLLRALRVGMADVEAVVRPGGGPPRAMLVTTRHVVHEDEAFLAVFARDVTERKLLEERLAHEATHDHLTGLANRSSLIAELDRASARAQRSGQRIGLLFIDLDQFKVVNDTLGHTAGDEVLRSVAERVRSIVRDTDLVARNGGDEFVVLAEDADDVATVVGLAERIQRALSDRFHVGGANVSISASIGIAFGGAGDGGLAQLHDADVAMYQAKALGPGRVRIFDDELRRSLDERVDLERRLRSAVGAGALDAFIQPVIDLRRGAVVSGELLCRWTTEEGHEVPPDAFIEVAENSSLVIEIDRWMLEQAGAVLAGWRRDGLDLTLSVNLSSRHLDEVGAASAVAEMCSRWGIESSRLVVEIAETSLLPDVDRARLALQQLHEVGVTICVDDFGSGFASLRHLRDLPIDLVKIDRSIIAGLGGADADTVIVSMLAHLSDLVGLELVAEGVETDDQRAELEDLGCRFAQGFLFARPMPLTTFPGWFTSWGHEHDPVLGAVAP